MGNTIRVPIMIDPNYGRPPSDICDVPTKYPWKGEGPQPARWTAKDGTVVYRSYTDYCADTGRI